MTDRSDMNPNSLQPPAASQSSTRSKYSAPTTMAQRRQRPTSWPLIVGAESLYDLYVLGLPIRHVGMRQLLAPASSNRCNTPQGARSAWQKVHGAQRQALLVTAYLIAWFGISQGHVRHRLPAGPEDRIAPRWTLYDRDAEPDKISVGGRASKCAV
jgi:hypothetical protein